MDDLVRCFLAMPRRVPPEESGEQFNRTEMVLVGLVTIVALAVASIAVACVFT